MTISPEAKEAARNELLTDAGIAPHIGLQEGHHVQLAINFAAAPLQKEIERLRGEVEKAWKEGNYRGMDGCPIYDYSRAKRVAEGKE